ncbi:hypothetical protein O7626_10485 [Micromonospora sp. WMMD1102]|nr:hypothetical protein [Micromonospora sp. WMMD1102]MDG4786350.1 hypothetical protein [Micromonospora sp. WMMD1102]
MYGPKGPPTGGGLAVTGVALQSWLLAGLGLLILGTAMVLLVMQKRTR